jgi:hypothetical protein
MAAVCMIDATAQAAHCLFLLQAKANVSEYLQNCQLSQDVQSPASQLSRPTSRQDLNPFSLLNSFLNLISIFKSNHLNTHSSIKTIGSIKNPEFPKI